MQGNRSGVIGCGFWNNDCGGLNLTVVWEIAFCIIFGLLVVVFPFFIFFYEADDEGLGLENKVRKDEEGNVIPEPEGFLAKLLDFRSCKRSLCSAIVYTLITIVISVVVLVVMYSFLAQAQIPYRATSVTVDSVAFLPGSCTPPRVACHGGGMHALLLRVRRFDVCSQCVRWCVCAMLGFVQLVPRLAWPARRAHASSRAARERATGRTASSP
ncbi:hypothetical protein EON66_10345, partial [archaeon]